MVVPKINSAHGSDTRNILNRAIEVLNRLGIDIQTLVAEGQLTPEEYAQLITIVNSNLKSGHVDFSDLNDSTRQKIEGLDQRILDIIKALDGSQELYTPIGLEEFMTIQDESWVI